MTNEARSRARPGGSNAFGWRARLRSFRYAASGLVYILRTQPNAWIHGAAALLVCAAGLWLRVSAADWRWLVVATTLVWAAETMNTAFEYVCDVVSPAFHPAVAKAKDIAAAAVLICAAGAALIGVLTFWPYVGFE